MFRLLLWVLVAAWEFLTCIWTLNNHISAIRNDVIEGEHRVGCESYISLILQSFCNTDTPSEVLCIVLSLCLVLDAIFNLVCIFLAYLSSWNNFLLFFRIIELNVIATYGYSFALRISLTYFPFLTHSPLSPLPIPFNLSLSDLCFVFLVVFILIKPKNNWPYFGWESIFTKLSSLKLRAVLLNICLPWLDSLSVISFDILCAWLLGLFVGIMLDLIRLVRGYPWDRQIILSILYASDVWVLKEVIVRHSLLFQPLNIPANSISLMWLKVIEVDRILILARTDITRENRFRLLLLFLVQWIKLLLIIIFCNCIDLRYSTCDALRYHMLPLLV